MIRVLKEKVKNEKIKRFMFIFTQNKVSKVKKEKIKN